MINELFSVKGRLNVTLRDSDGAVKSQIDIPNLIVQVGKNFMATAVIAASASPFVSIAVGTSATAPTTSDTVLGAEIARVAFATSSTAANVVTLTANFAGGVGTGTLTEAGIFNSNTASTGVMLSHVTYGAIVKGSTDTLAVTWTITVG